MSAVLGGQQCLNNCSSSYLRAQPRRAPRAGAQAGSAPPFADSLAAAPPQPVTHRGPGACPWKAAAGEVPVLSGDPRREGVFGSPSHPGLSGRALQLALSDNSSAVISGGRAHKQSKGF